MCGSFSAPWWMLILIAVVFIGFSMGWWAKVWEWAKTKYTAMTGKTIEADNWLDAVAIPVLRTYKVQQSLRVALREFELKGDKETVAAINDAIAKAATWTED